MILNYKKELFFVLLFVLLFIFIRSINFEYYLTFNGWDQGEQAIEILQVFKNKDIVLLGPRVTSISYESRYIFLGPAMTYLMMFFLWAGKWNPILSSYIFMLFAGLMILPLYYGVKWLLGKKVAWLMVIVYTLAPYYITYTRFLWNPNFQFALLPILFLLMALYKKKKKPIFLFAVSFFLGILLQLHYQFILSVGLLFFYYFIYKKEGLKNLLFFLAGLLFGLLPLILFELRNQFYLTNTLWIYLQHRKELVVLGHKNHYYLSLSFIILLGVLAFFHKKIQTLHAQYIKYFFIVLTVILLLLSSQITIRKPSNSFWAPVPYWNYLIEEKIYAIIKKQNIRNFNVTNQLYDSLANVQKYLLRRDNVNINYDDYYDNTYLFVIDKIKIEKSMENPGYEVKTFRPYKLMKTWNLNHIYKLYLVKRIK